MLFANYIIDLHRRQLIVIQVELDRVPRTCLPAIRWRSPDHKGIVINKIKGINRFSVPDVFQFFIRGSNVIFIVKINPFV